MRPFPLPFSIGIDICHVPRIVRILTMNDGRQAMPFVRKVLNRREFVGRDFKERLARLENAKWSEGVGMGVLSVLGGQEESEREIQELGRWIAGRWAAKEATIKAFTTQRLTMQDITVMKGDIVDGLQTAPVVSVLVRKQLQAQMATMEGNEEDIIDNEEVDNEKVETEEREVKCSISHDGDYAIATCLVAHEDAYK